MYMFLRVGAKMTVVCYFICSRMWAMILMVLVVIVMSTNCKSLKTTSSSTIRVYIYDLPTSLNIDILNEAKRRFEVDRFSDFSNRGYGAKVQDAPNTENVSIHNTNQFSLEVIMHNKLLNSVHRTDNPSEADVFYVPAYAGLKCMMNTDWFTDNLQDFMHELDTFLRNQTYFQKGKPHVSSIAKIHREMSGVTIGCQYLNHPITKDITFLAIEKETDPELMGYLEDAAKSLIVVPYPSYLHFNSETQKTRKRESNDAINFSGEKPLEGTMVFNAEFSSPNRRSWNTVISSLGTTYSSSKILNKNTENGITLTMQGNSQNVLKDFQPNITEGRDILALYPVGVSKFPYIREVLDSQFVHKTHLSYEQYIASCKFDNTSNMVQVATYDSGEDTITTTISWMRHSVFCLQPPGDSPTRKSFYDSVLCGCIPVIFLENEIPYAFSSILNYNEFAVVIKISEFINNKDQIANILNEINISTILKIQQRLTDVSKFLQYSLDENDNNDALELIMYELRQKFQL